LSTNDKYNPLIDVTTKSALGASNLTRIISDDKTPWPDSGLFGKENRDTWCYYYESADLYRQLGKWNDVIDFYEEATAKGYEPFNGVELMPFIEAYARVGRADVAMDLTMLAKDLTPSLRDYTCDNWNRIAKDIINDPIFTAEYQAYSQQDLCWEVK
jgi:tetratricopeptide (TPR) repeat protein